MGSKHEEPWRLARPGFDLDALMRRLVDPTHRVETAWRNGAFDLNRLVSQETRDRLARITAELVRNTLPPNLRDVDGVTFAGLLVVLDEGVPLYGVPRARIAARLLLAPDSRARRHVIGQEYTAILADCAELLASMDASPLAYERDAITEAIALAGAGHPRAAQALAANVMDSFAWMWLREQGITWADWGHLTRKKGKGDTDKFMDEWTVAAAFAWRPVWVSFNEFKPWKGDPVPTTFNRHASLHAVSRRQYNKRNTALAIMFATSLWYYLMEWGNLPAR